jgi:hypothetical protein
MTFDLSTISIFLQSILVAVVIVLCVFAWRWLRVALDRGQLQAQNEALAQLTVYAKIFVNAAEQTLTKQPGFAKLDWVLDQFATVMPDVDKDLIRSVVEATVKAMPKPPPKPLTLAAPPTTTFTSGSTGYMDGPPAPPPPAACDDLAPQRPPPATSHSHKDRGKPKAAQTV